MGSQCTLIRQSDFNELKIDFEPVNTMSLKSFGNFLIKPIGKATLNFKVQNVSTTVEVLIVQDNLLKYPILLGHTFTEQNGITIIKTDKELIIHKTLKYDDIGKKVNLVICENLDIEAMASIPLQTENNEESFNVYIQESVRISKKFKIFYLTWFIYN